MPAPAATSRRLTALLLAAVAFALFGCMSPPKLAPLSIPAKSSVTSIEVNTPQGLKHTITDPAVIGQIIDDLNRMNGPFYEPVVTETMQSATVEIHDGEFIAGLFFTVVIRPNSIAGFSFNSGTVKYGCRAVPPEQMARFFALIGVPYPK